MAVNYLPSEVRNKVSSISQLLIEINTHIRHGLLGNYLQLFGAQFHKSYFAFLQSVQSEREHLQVMECLNV
jgi:hypothetical protein